MEVSKSVTYLKRRKKEIVKLTVTQKIAYAECLNHHKERNYQSDCNTEICTRWVFESSHFIHHLHLKVHVSYIAIPYVLESQIFTMIMIILIKEGFTKYFPGYRSL